MPKRMRKAVQRHGGGENANLPAVSKRVPFIKPWNVFSQPTPVGQTLSSDNRVHRFVQTVDYGNLLTSSAGAAVFLGKSFTFVDLPQQSQFGALFDQYRVDQIELWITPTSTTANLQQTGTTYAVVVDYDDDNTPSTPAQLLNYTNVVEQTVSNALYLKWQPHVANALYGGGVFTSFGNKPCGWIDSGSSSVRLYGVKMFCGSSASTVVFQFRARFHFSTRNTF